MLAVGSLSSTFKIYWDDMKRCRTGRAYWALLHVTVCLPDICAALQSNDGDTNKRRYKAWCNKYLPDPLLSGSERWQMRCKVLHEGRASIPRSMRYDGFAFTQPAPTGPAYHKQLEGKTLVLDVGEMAEEMKNGVEAWIHDLEANPSSSKAINADSNLRTVIKVRPFVVPSITYTAPIIINRSS